LTAGIEQTPVDSAKRPLYGIYIDAAQRGAGIYTPPCHLYGSGSGAHPMLDVVFVAASLGFFVVAIAYTFACARL
jgi:hypothetical protein